MDSVQFAELKVRLSVVLGQRGSLHEWTAVETGVASALMEVECLRTLDKLRLLEGIAESEIARRREAVYRILKALTVVEPTRPILARAAQPFPVVLGTLDAIHLATALLWRECSEVDLGSGEVPVANRGKRDSGIHSTGDTTYYKYIAGDRSSGRRILSVLRPDRIVTS